MLKEICPASLTRSNTRGALQVERDPWMFWLWSLLLTKAMASSFLLNLGSAQGKKRLLGLLAAKCPKKQPPPRASGSGGMNPSGKAKRPRRWLAASQ